MEIKEIKKAYGKKTILNGASLSVGKGCCVGILGGNGSGKSTLFSVLAGVQSKDSGSFYWENSDLLKEHSLRNKVVGYVPQGNPLIEELTAWDNLRLWYTREELHRELKEGVLAMLGIPDFIKLPVCKMSGGMKKRVSIGCAVANHPEILLLDEPSAALDLICKVRIGNYLKEFTGRGGIVLLATHDIHELEQCDACYILKDGVLVPYQYDGNVHHLIGRL